MKIQLYTCEAGVKLFNRGSKFGAWNETAKSYHEADENIKILVDEEDIRAVENEDGAYNVMNIQSVEIIGG